MKKSKTIIETAELVKQVARVISNSYNTEFGKAIAFTKCS